jgi:hypothetical protein
MTGDAGPTGASVAKCEYIAAQATNNMPANAAAVADSDKCCRSSGLAGRIDRPLTACVMGPDWTESNADADWHIRIDRDLLFQFVGGEETEQLREAFEVPAAA